MEFLTVELSHFHVVDSVFKLLQSDFHQEAKSAAAVTDTNLNVEWCVSLSAYCSPPTCAH